MNIIYIKMPFLNSLFNCNSSDSNDEDQNKISIIKNIEEGRVERLFMKVQLEELARRVDSNNVKAMSIFGVEKDIAVINSNINHIKKDITELTDDLKMIKKSLIK